MTEPKPFTVADVRKMLNPQPAQAEQSVPVPSDAVGSVTVETVEIVEPDSESTSKGKRR